MPLYDYIEEATGATVERFVSMAERDNQAGYRRVFKPCRLGIPGSAHNPWTMEAGVRRGLKAMEEKGTLPNHSFSKETLKKVWCE